MKKSLIAFVLLLIILSVRAQSSLFTPNFFSPLSLNPSFAGSTGAGRMTFTFQDQFPSTGNSGSVNSGFGYDQYIGKIKAGIGIQYQYGDNNGWGNWNRGVMSTHRLDFVYAQHFQLFDNQLTIVPSVDFGYIHESIDMSKIAPVYIDPVFLPSSLIRPFASSDQNVFDLSGGLLVHTKRLIAGFSMSHLAQPVIGDVSPAGLESAPLMRIYTFHMSYTFGNISEPNRGWYAAPGFILKYHAYPDNPNMVYHVLVPGVTVGYKSLSVGCAYVQEESFEFTAGFRNKHFSVGYSYDLMNPGSSVNSEYASGIHKLSLRVNLFGKNKPDSFLAAPAWLF